MSYAQFCCRRIPEIMRKVNGRWYRIHKLQQLRQGRLQLCASISTSCHRLNARKAALQ